MNANPCIWPHCAGEKQRSGERSVCVLIRLGQPFDGRQVVVVRPQERQRG